MVDLAILASRDGRVSNFQFADRLRGFQQSVGNLAVDTATTPTLITSSTAAESTSSNSIFVRSDDDMTVRFSSAANTNGYSTHAFKRAPGVFDVVCYIGTGSATTLAHGLGVAPELMIVKGRGNANNWEVYYGNPATATRIYLNMTTTGAHFSGLFNDTAPTPFVFTVGTSSSTNASGIAFVTYLFATKAGISKVGSYIGNGGTQTINCGFTTGARFVLIKRTDSAGDWYVWDTVRGIVAGNDPHLSLNTTAAEVTTDDSIDPDSTGFVVNQLATTNISVTSATYIYLAFA